MTFAREWEFNSSIYGIARWSFGAPIAKLITGSVFFAAWLFLFRRWSAGEASRASGPASLPGAEVYGMLFLLSATVNPWYLLWLAPFVALRPTTTGVAAMALVSLSYVTGLNLGTATVANFEHPDWVRPIEYGGIALAAIADWWRWRAGLTATPQPVMSAVF